MLNLVVKVRKFAGQNVSNENIYVSNSAVVGNKQSFKRFPKRCGHHENIFCSESGGSAVLLTNVNFTLITFLVFGSNPILINK